MVPKHVTQPRSFYEFIALEPEWNWWSGNCNGDETDIRQIAAHIEQGNGLAVSDGSFKDGLGTAACVIEGKTPGQRIVTTVMVPGEHDEQCAYRSEAAGILAATQLVHAICLYFKICEGKVQICCDGQSALNQSFYEYIHTKAPHYDILVKTRQTREMTTIIWEPYHVKGHQTIFPLDRQASLNYEMDLLCKSFWTSTLTTKRIWFRSLWQVECNGRRISSNIAGTIREQCSILRAEQYWNNKQTSIAQDINWTATEVANKKMGNGRQTWITKHVSGFCATRGFSQD
jgi:hypothetical protein